MQLDEVSLDTTKFLSSSAWSPVKDLDHRALDYGVNLNVNTRLLGVIYANNTLHSYLDSDAWNPQSQTQFRTIGWEYTCGLHVSGSLDVGVYHYSEHVLDMPYPGGYQQKTGVVIKIYLQRKTKDDTVF